MFPALSVRENLRVAHRSAPASAAGPWAAWRDEIARDVPAARRAARAKRPARCRVASSRCWPSAGPSSATRRSSCSTSCRWVWRRSSSPELFERIAALRDTGRTIVLVEQYLTYALELADLCYVLAKGKVAWAGDPSELRPARPPPPSSPATG